jgi:hypothetical protein
MESQQIESIERSTNKIDEQNSKIIDDFIVALNAKLITDVLNVIPSNRLKNEGFDERKRRLEFVENCLKIHKPNLFEYISSEWMIKGDDEFNSDNSKIPLCFLYGEGSLINDDLLSRDVEYTKTKDKDDYKDDLAQFFDVVFKSRNFNERFDFYLKSIPLGKEGNLLSNTPETLYELVNSSKNEISEIFNQICQSQRFDLCEDHKIKTMTLENLIGRSMIVCDEKFIGSMDLIGNDFFSKFDEKMIAIQGTHRNHKWKSTIYDQYLLIPISLDKLYTLNPFNIVKHKWFVKAFFTDLIIKYIKKFYDVKYKVLFLGIHEIEQSLYLTIKRAKKQNYSFPFMEYYLLEEIPLQLEEITPEEILYQKNNIAFKKTILDIIKYSFWDLEDEGYDKLESKFTVTEMKDMEISSSKKNIIKPNFILPSRVVLPTRPGEFGIPSSQLFKSKSLKEYPWNIMDIINAKTGEIKRPEKTEIPKKPEKLEKIEKTEIEEYTAYINDTLNKQHSIKYGTVTRKKIPQKTKKRKNLNARLMNGHKSKADYKILN